MLLTITDTTGTQPETLAAFKVANVTTRPGGMLRAECVNDRTAETFAAFLTKHETRFVHSGPEIIIDLDSSDFDFSTNAATTAPLHTEASDASPCILTALAMELAGYTNEDAKACAARSTARALFRAWPGFDDETANSFARLAGMPGGITLSRRQVFPAGSHEIAG